MSLCGYNRRHLSRNRFAPVARSVGKKTRPIAPHSQPGAVARALESIPVFWTALSMGVVTAEPVGAGTEGRVALGPDPDHCCSLTIATLPSLAFSPALGSCGRLVGGKEKQQKEDTEVLQQTEDERGPACNTVDKWHKQGKERKEERGPFPVYEYQQLYTTTNYIKEPRLFRVAISMPSTCSTPRVSEANLRENGMPTPPATKRHL
ncbi:hypothetical protein EYF80_026117 [Liparis tanakae]|uniref:Uncharacterized protein n=1 Tax=Liparis tanakae TaxID=230148 RepID=A0A4Z2HCY9_9TELE|nr:hypothetical protein EYF80_026117 [Liparis tanakae]